jgi:hypothetical protein
MTRLTLCVVLLMPVAADAIDRCPDGVYREQCEPARRTVEDRTDRRGSSPPSGSAYQMSCNHLVADARAHADCQRQLKALRLEEDEQLLRRAAEGEVRRKEESYQNRREVQKRIEDMMGGGRRR